jgi:uncharacterized circularly permuted ATP-grasp superfamily protein/uncharacterized alpha-E superfamily protein
VSQSAGASAQPTFNARIADLVSNYQPLPGVPDEFIGADGLPRPHWRRLIDTVANLSADEMKRRFANADRHLRDAGVSYRVSGEGGQDTLADERSWPLSHVPLVISAEEWRQISAGVVQRATLSSRILEDVYGEGDLVNRGLLPAGAISGSLDYLRPLQGVKPRGGFLTIYAADLGRGPDGRWWVLGDRTQAPSGAGYALENRLALSRSFPDLYRELDVERLAPFFQNFRAGLAAMAERSEPRICLLTPGPYNETYFEQAYLARYLGFLLVEGADLIMRNGQLLVRTIAGLKRADVLWRRIDADFADPLELNSASQLGVPGLVEAVRDGRLAMANALGSGWTEARALMGFLPVLCRHLLDQELLLPSVATWWCGQARERELVLDNLDNLAIAHAFRDGPGAAPVLPANMTPEARQALAADIMTRGLDYVGQEVVQLSTMPVYEDGRLQPRPFTLRVYAAMTPDGWQVMPGGFCRISDRQDVRAISMRDGVRSADVWVLADGPVAHTSLLPPSDAIPIKRILGNLPSRAADNMFWLGRYLERVEATLRLVRCLMSRLLDADVATNENGATLAKLAQMLSAWGCVPEEITPRADAQFAVQALHGDAYGSALSLVWEARRTASVIRERLSPDAWRILSDLQHRLEGNVSQPHTEADALERCEHALRAIAAFSGLAQENMNRVAGWRFLQIGRRLERAISTCRFARVFADKSASVGDLEVLLDLADSQITYRSRYLIGAALVPVRDLVLLDPYNPRSVGFQVDSLDEHIASLPTLRQDGILEVPRRLSMELATDLRTLEASAIDRQLILATEQKLMSLSDAVAVRYFLQGPQGGRAERLTGLA